MACDFYGQGLSGRRRGSQGYLGSAVLLSAGLLLLAGCEEALDAAGLQGKSDQSTASAGPLAGTEAETRPRGHRGADRPEAAVVARIQDKLSLLGYRPGPVDGIAGPRTEAAIRRFQADMKLTVDGKISTELAAALRKARKPRIEAKAAPVPAETPAVAKPIESAAGGLPASNADEVSMNAIQPPYYEAGDSYIYSNGRIETVVGIDGERVDWAVNDGSHFTATRNFTLPPLRVEAAGASMEFSVTAAEANKWPPGGTGAPWFYHAEASGAPANRGLREAWSGDWRCRLGQPSASTVPAGRFDVVSISCERIGDDGAKREVVWDYAPALRHYVRRTETSDGSDKATVVTLVAVRPAERNWSRSARSGFGWAVQKLLDRGTVGDSIEWKIAKPGIDFEIALTGDFVTSRGVSCRRYMVSRRHPGTPRLFPALACRAKVGDEWRIVGSDNGPVTTEDLLAIR